MPPRLIVEFQGETRVVELPQGETTIGRSSQSDLPLPDPSLSRQHCLLRVSFRGTLLEDLGSRNGTYVNGHRVFEHWLKKGDEIHIGAAVLYYEAKRGATERRETRTRTGGPRVPDFRVWVRPPGSRAPLAAAAAVLLATAALAAGAIALWPPSDEGQRGSQDPGIRAEATQDRDGAGEETPRPPEGGAAEPAPTAEDRAQAEAARILRDRAVRWAEITRRAEDIARAADRQEVFSRRFGSGPFAAWAREGQQRMSALTPRELGAAERAQALLEEAHAARARGEEALAEHLLDAVARLYPDTAAATTARPPRENP